MYEKGLTDTLISLCRSVLEATWKFAGQAAPRHAPDLTKSLGSLRDRLTPGISTGEIGTVQSEIERALGACGEAAAQSSEDSVNQIRQIMLAVASSAAEIANRDSRYSGKFLDLASKVQSTARLSDLNAMRRSVIACADEMKSCVRKMAEEGSRAVAGLKAEIEGYRVKLDDYQKRDATDPLTGLGSRTAIEARIQDRMIWKAGFCVAVFDLNGFKRINDTHGHSAGDDLLRQFARELRPLFRSVDLVGRWGGDEFVVVIDAEKAEAQAIIARVCDWAFGEYEFTGEAGVICEVITAAIGVAQWDGQESAIDLFNRADRLMYDDKKTIRITRARTDRARGSTTRAV